MTHGSWLRSRAHRKGDFPMKHSIAGILGVIVLLATAGCTSEDPALYLGGPPGPTVGLRLSSNRVTVVVGDSVALGARGSDAAGNPTADQPSFTSCDPSVATVGSAITDPVYTNSAWVVGVGLGVSCIAVQAAGVTDTVLLTTGPATVTITGPDTLGSGNSGTFVAEATDRAGNALTGTTSYAWSSSSVPQLAIDPETGIASGRGTGAANIQVFAPGGANGVKRVIVVPGVFGGTLSAASGAPGSLITVSRAADAPLFDADQGTSLRGVAAYVDVVAPGQFSFAVPATGSTTADTLTLLNIGPAQLAQVTTFAATKTNADVYSPGNMTNDCSDPATPIDYASAKSPLGWVYMVHTGSVQGATGCQNGGAGNDHYILYETGGASESVNVTAEWRLAGDIDLYICTTDYSDCPAAGFSGNTNNEVVNNVPLAANSSYFVIFSPWTANAGVNNVRLKIAKN